MQLVSRDAAQAVIRFLRTPTLSRSVTLLLAVAIALLLAANVATFVMITRTGAFNATVEKSSRLRLTAKDVLVQSVDAETGQRGFLLTGRAEYLEPYDHAVANLPVTFAQLDSLALDDADVGPRVERLRELSQLRMRRIALTLELARSGRIGEAVAAMRSGEGKQLMDAMRAETSAIDEVLATRLEFRTRQSEWGSTVTVIVNAIGGLLILVLAGMSAWLVRRYVKELQTAREEVAAANLGLEDKVRERTGDLIRANEEIQRFAYIVSHDLRAPLVNVMGYTSELEQAGKTIDRAITEAEKARTVDKDVVMAVREDMPEAIGFIRTSTEKMDRLINAILKLSREGRRTLVPEVLEMTPLVQAIADSVRHQTEAADAVITVEPLPHLDSDRLSIEQVFGNLVDNAVKYLDPKRPGRITISGETAPGGWVVYRIADNGRGISPKDHERIFELFRRSGRQDRPGEGLGLAFVRNSVRRLGGSIDIESELDRGSTFTLKFPKRLVLQDAGDTA
ncbi:MAG: histidine kinase [Brevundimonas sp.]|nr:MAG: histidine kinase [Brevundimonas sp.]